MFYLHVYYHSRRTFNKAVFIFLTHFVYVILFHVAYRLLRQFLTVKWLTACMQPDNCYVRRNRRKRKKKYRKWTGNVDDFKYHLWFLPTLYTQTMCSMHAHQMHLVQGWKWNCMGWCLGFISIMQYRYIDRGFVDLAILRGPEIGWYRPGMHISHVRCSPVQTKRSYRQ